MDPLNTHHAAAASAPEPLTNEEFAKFCEFFYRKTGIMFDTNKKYFVERRLLERIVRSGSDGFRDYFTKLRFEIAGLELQQLVNQMTVNETYFFREDYQFDVLVKGLLPDLAAGRERGRPIRIWSLPCASGEEPYSLAIYILEHWAEADDHDIEILASDIDSAILAEAMAGCYGQRSLQRIPVDLLRKYFVKERDGRHRISDDLRASIDFSLVNVVDPLAMRQYRDIDIIFCRNMLIYFDDKSRREAIETMYDCLAPGGYICLGHSESMSRISSLFRPKKFADSIIYQKPLEIRP